MKLTGFIFAIEIAGLLVSPLIAGYLYKYLWQKYGARIPALWRRWFEITMIVYTLVFPTSFIMFWKTFYTVTPAVGIALGYILLCSLAVAIGCCIRNKEYRPAFAIPIFVCALLWYITVLLL